MEMELRDLRESASLLERPDLLRQRLAEEGYLYLPGFVPSAVFVPLRQAFARIAHDAGWLREGTSPEQFVVDPAMARDCPRSEFLRVHYRMFELERLHRAPHHPSFTAFFARLFEAEPFAHPQVNIRVRFPDRDEFTTPPHQDHVAIRGTPDTLALWIPLTDCSPEMGGLQVLPGSHRHGLLEIHQDPVTGFYVVDGALPDDWIGGRYRAGDALIFHSLTVHRGRPNRSDRLRISIDSRFQRLSDCIAPASLSPLNGLSSWEPVYETWQSRDLCYYWRSRQLNFSPSIPDLQAIASSPDHPHADAARAMLQHV